MSKVINRLVEETETYSTAEADKSWEQDFRSLHRMGHTGQGDVGNLVPSGQPAPWLVFLPAASSLRREPGMIFHRLWEQQTKVYMSISSFKILGQLCASSSTGLVSLSGTLIAAIIVGCRIQS